MGAYLVPQEKLQAWVKHQVGAWAHRIRVLGKISRRHPQSYYSELGVLLQLECQYLQRIFPKASTLMSPI